MADAERALPGRVALVTGANHGIGAATATALARLGADVAVSWWRLHEHDDGGQPPAYGAARRGDASAVVAEIEAAGSRALSVEADLSDPDGPAQLFATVEDRLGPIEILVNNASGWRRDTFAPVPADLAQVGDEPDELVSAATFAAQFLVDARAGALLIAELARRHRARGAHWGRIVSLTSGGPNGFPGEVSYGAAKAALENYTMSAASELADLAITANVVHPPVTDTGWVTDEIRALVATNPNLMHIAAPAEVAEVIAWLCTDAARLVSGTLLRLR